VDGSNRTKAKKRVSYKIFSLHCDSLGLFVDQLTEKQGTVTWCYGGTRSRQHRMTLWCPAGMTRAVASENTKQKKYKHPELKGRVQEILHL
jgi:hypothetical protein